MARSTVYDVRDRETLSRIAWMYFIHGMNQEEIGRKLGYSRTTITRLIARAREEGIVEIRINSEYRSCFEMELALEEQLGLRDAIVVPTARTDEERDTGVGSAAAQYLEKIIEDGDMIGSGWGRHLYRVADSLHETSRTDLTVVQLLGGLNSGGGINPQAIVETVARKLGAEGIWLTTPAVVDSEEIRDALLRDKGVRRALSAGRRATKAVFGIGDATDRASLVTANALTVREIRELRSLGAVGDILGRHFDIHGSLVTHPVMERIIGLGPEEIRRIPLKICGAAGAGKVKPIIGAVRGGFVTVLVTDESTAGAILEYVSETGDR